MFTCSLTGSVSSRSYDEPKHLGRVPVQCVENEEPVELFSINAVERGEPGGCS